MDSCSHLKEHQELLQQNRCAATIIWSILDGLLSIDSVLDLGCGIGVWMEAALSKRGRQVVGIDLEAFDQSELVVPPAAIINAALDQRIDLHRQFDLVLCLETAEHIQADGAATLVSNCVRHSNAVLFSAAIPGQGGLHHVNERPPEYWQDLFDQAGYEVLDIIRPLIWRDTRIPAWYRQNMLLIVNRNAGAAFDRLRSESGKTPVPLHRAHPDLLQSHAHELARCRGLLEQGSSDILLAELRVAELQSDLVAQRDFSGRALSESWDLVNKVRSRMQLMESERSALTQHVVNLEAALAHAERDRADLRASLSWRLTAPLRALGALLLRKRNH
jgi:SAM-dependent methyltransferase